MSVEASERPDEKTCDVDDCAAWRKGDSVYCRNHVGLSEGRAEEGNQRATRHGLHADPVNLLEDLRENDEKAYGWIQEKFESYLRQAPFERGSAHADQLLQICVREYSIWKASGIQVDEGVLTEQAKVAGERIIKEPGDNPANKALDRMERTVVKRLEKLGVMPSPDQQAADAQKDLAALWQEDLQKES